MAENKRSSSRSSCILRTTAFIRAAFCLCYCIGRQSRRTRRIRASVFERGFAQNDWRNSWRNGVYSFAHYHSTAHEALGVYSGSAKLRLGGEHGQTVEVRSGDVILIPAGVAHHNIGTSPDFSDVGAYPDGRQWDLLRGLPGERPKSDHTIAALPIPDYDPISALTVHSADLESRGVTQPSWLVGTLRAGLTLQRQGRVFNS